MYDKELINKIKKKNPIREVAAELGLPIPPFGTMPCIFPDEHGRGDQVPSLRLDEGRQTLKCWGCGKVNNWDVIDLVRHQRRCSFGVAVQWLADRAGILVPVRAANTPGYDKAHPHAESSYEALTGFAKEAIARLDAGGREYWLGRGVTEEVITSQHLGYISDYEVVCEAMKQRGITSEALKSSGLTSFYVYGKEGIPFVTIPYIGVVRGGGGGKKGRSLCVYIKARRVVDGPVPKYLVTKGEVPFLYNAAALDTTDKVFVCEGEVDCLTLLSHGYPAVGVPGADGFKERWAESFRGKSVYLVMDSDRAGRKATRDISRQLAGIAREVRKVRLPSGADVNSFFKGEVGHG